MAFILPGEVLGWGRHVRALQVLVEGKKGKFAANGREEDGNLESPVSSALQAQ